jgi:hypothetical protein
MTPSLIENERELSGMHDRVKESLKEWDLVMRRRSNVLHMYGWFRGSENASRIR